MSRISNYEELMAERKSLEATLLVQKASLNKQLNTLKESFEPLTKVVSFFSGLNQNPGSSLLKVGTNLAIATLVRGKLAKAGWLAKLILPFILKYTAAKTIDSVQEKITAHRPG
jgi:hypothetical protein